MAVIRRHWKLAVFNAALLLAVLAGAASYYVSSQRTAVAATEAKPAAPVERMSLESYGRVETVRQSVALSAMDLASAGVSGPQAETVLTALKTWCDANAGRLAQAEQAKRAAEAELAEAVRKVNVGPRDEALLARYPALEASVRQATAGVKQLHDEAFNTVTASLMAGQRQVLQTAARNLGVPEQLRYVSGLTDEQRRAAVVAAAKQRSVVEASRRGAVATAEANRARNVEAVIAAQNSVLPVPAELIAESTPDNLTSGTNVPTPIRP